MNNSLPDIPIIEVSDTEKVKIFLDKIKLHKNSSKKKNRRLPDKKEYTVFGRPLKHIPRQFKQDVANFTGYLAETAQKYFKITTKKGDEIRENCIEYVHRWTKLYRRALLAKLYQLQDYVVENNLTDQLTMITLTVPQRGKDQEECLFELLSNYNKLLKLMRYYLKTQDYFYVLEPHETGYCHMHILYIKKLTDAEKDNIIRIWSKKYFPGCKGVEEHGVNFADPRESFPSDYHETCSAGSITFLRSYLMKYVSKGLYSESMTKGELLFNSLLKKHNIRLWNSSRHLSQVMKQREDTDSDTEESETLKIELYQDGEFVKQIYPAPKIEEQIPTHKPAWVPLQTVSMLTDKILKQIDHQLLKVEPLKTEFIDKRGNVSFIEEYMLYESVYVTMNENDIKEWKLNKALFKNSNTINYMY